MSEPAPADPAASSYGLTPRPQADPVVLAVLASAMDQAWPRPAVVVEAPSTAGPAWRFSGRWWTRPTAVRRDRPWSRG